MSNVVSLASMPQDWRVWTPDEIYADLLYDGRHHSIAQEDGTHLFRLIPETVSVFAAALALA